MKICFAIERQTSGAKTAEVRQWNAQWFQAPTLQGELVHAPRKDRKSTRLNSSH